MTAVHVAAAVCCLSSLEVLTTASRIASAEPSVKRILQIHQFGINRPGLHVIDAAFVKAMRSGDVVFDLYQETIESERFPGPEQSRLVREYLKRKYADRKIDVIVTEGDTALTFARQNRELFGDPAIVAVVLLAGQFVGRHDNVTGLEGGFALGKTIELGLALRPDTRNVFVVDGTRGNVEDVQTEIERQWKDLNRRIALVYLRDLPLSDVVSRLAAIPDQSIVLFVRQTMRDRLWDMDQFDALAQVVGASRAPVFSINELHIGRGIVGGYVRDFEADAKRVAELAKRIANGASPQDIRPGHTTVMPVFDWNQLQRWDIPKARLPAGSVVLFRPQSFFEIYRRYVAGGLLIFAGQLALIVGLLVQRVRRRRAEEQTRNSEERYRSVVDTQSELICRFLPDSTLTFVNDAYCRFWNKSREELLGTSFLDVIPPAARESVLEHIGRIRCGMDSHEHPVTLLDGTVGWHHWINHAIVDEHGQLLELQGVGRDITDRRRAEEAVTQLEARNSAMLRAIPDLMFVLLPDGTCVDYHARDPKLLFVPPGKFLGRTIRDVMPPALADMFMDALDRASRSPEPVVVEYELPMDELRCYEARLVDAEHGRFLSMVRDVTESKRAQELNRDLAGRLIASQEDERQRIARELHDDLSQKIALLNIEIDQLVGELKADEHRSRLRKISLDAAGIATDVHNLSHELHPSKLQTLGLVAAMQSLCRDVSRQFGVDVAFSAAGLPESVDPNVSLCLYRITQEALHNVARHSGAREASVRLTRDDDGLSLQIADPGIGFDPRVQHAGLGLISMRERVSFVKGQLAIHAFPGGGTHLDVRVPLAPMGKVSFPAISQSA
jgi:PAS domain S-box-containing protein